MRRRALVTGITGQDGAHLARFLLDRGYEVHGTSRRVTPENVGNLVAVGALGEVALHVADPAESRPIRDLLAAVKPDEVYHLASQSSVGVSFEDPTSSVMAAVRGTINILDTIRLERPSTRFYHAASSEMFGGTPDRPATARDPFHPRSPYAVGKAAAHWMTINYRETYGLHACSGILYNHESPLRSERFVTRKVTATVARIKAGLDRELRLGNLAVRRDWGYAPEYVEAMWLMLQRDTPDDYVIATGTAHSLQEFVEAAFAEVGLDWRGYTVSDAQAFRPNEVTVSIGDPRLAARDLGWKARTGFRELVGLMVRHDVGALRQGKVAP